MSRFDKCLKEVLKHEGGFVNHPRDPGGATNFGITLGTYRATLKPNATVDDIRRIPVADVRKIYRHHYWKPIDGDGLGPGVDLAVFDLAVNSGTGRAKKMFREVMHLHGRDNAALVNQLCENRMAFLRRLKHWNTFGTGWTRRVKEVRAASLAALGQTPRPAGPIDHTEAHWLVRFFKWLFSSNKGIRR